jgi:hypothetical protein
VCCLFFGDFANVFGFGAAFLCGDFLRGDLARRPAGDGLLRRGDRLRFFVRRFAPLAEFDLVLDGLRDVWRFVVFFLLFTGERERDRLTMITAGNLLSFIPPV